MTGALTIREALFTAGKEGLVRETYKDSKAVSTWAYGITNKSGHHVDRYRGVKASYERCAEVYIWLLQRYLAEVEEAFEGLTLTEAQRAAALSFHWNTGSIKKASWVDAFKRGDLSDARRRFMLWRKPAEIVERRRAECDLFFDAAWPKNLRDAKRIGAVNVLEYTRLRRSGAPDWSSAKTINVTPHFRAAMRRVDNPKAKASPAKEPAVAFSGAALLLIVLQWFGFDTQTVTEFLKGIF